MQVRRTPRPRLEPRTARVPRHGGSNTTEFLYRNFGDGTHHDTVYVTANPKAIKLEQSYLDRLVFHDLIDVTDENATIPGYVAPGGVAEAARDAADRYPNKRLVVHLDQPHAPYCGPTAEEVCNQHDLEQLEFHTLRPLIKTDDMSLDTLRTMYHETLDTVIDVVDGLVADLDGRILVTADHGGLLGEQLVRCGRG